MEIMMVDFRSVGFSEEASKYPRNDLALRMFAAFNGVTTEQLPEAFKFFPNESTQKAWNRVAEAALSTDAEPVTSKMVNDAWNAGKERHMTGTTEDFRAVVEAALSGKSEINTDRALQSRIDQYSVMGEDWLTYKATTAQLDFSKLYSHPLAKQFHDAIQTVDNLNCDTTSAVEQIKALSKSVEQEIDRLSVSPDGDVTEDMLNEGQERMCQLSSRTVFEDHIQAEVYKTMRAADPAFRPALSAQVQDVAEGKQLDLNISKEWFEKRAALEGDHEIGAGSRKLTACIEPTPDELVELFRIAHRIPEGWQLVPKEPTDEMHNAARDWAIEKYGMGVGRGGSDGCYRAMLAAAPAAKLEGKPDQNIMSMVSAYGRSPSQGLFNGIYDQYLSDCRKAELSGLQKATDTPTGWKRQPERYTNYPWYVEVERDGKWHLRHHGRMGIYRNISTHDTALDAMKAIPEAGD